jgi:flavin reductase (DIM6/NTAB) family NADH-FMN oxidoreductase RutF
VTTARDLLPINLIAAMSVAPFDPLQQFTSLSLDPPLVQWSIAKTTRIHSAFCVADHFAIHVLDAHQRELCDKFAARDMNESLRQRAVGNWLA